MGRLLSLLISCLFITPFVLAVPAARAQSVAPSTYSGLAWRLIGPFRGGRALAVTGVPGDPEHFYFGAVDGGVWESRNAGRTWAPIFDGVKIGSIGAIAVAPSNPNVLYVGSGEADMRSDIAYGNGMYKSTDAGKTWRRIGLEDTRQIGAIVVDPHDPNVAYVAALGHAYGPNAQRGVFKTTDGGTTWTRVLYKDENTGAIDLSMDPSDSKTIFAALWQTRRPPWNVYPPSSGPGSGLYVTHDAGATWSPVTAGLPAKVGRIGVAVSPANPKRVYAIVDSDLKHGGVYRSDDGGATWAFQSGRSEQLRIWRRGWYFGGITADPKNPDIVYAMNTATYRSQDGGKHFDAIRGAPGGDDYHTLWIDPNDAARMILGSDQGVVVSVDTAKTWSSWYNQPTGQFYHVIADDSFPYRLFGAQQDSGAMMVPSSSRHAGIGQFDWRPVDVGGESGYVAPDPLHAGYVFGGTVTAENIETGWEQTIDPTLAYPGTIWRNAWTLPLAFSMADKRSLYFGHQRVFRSRSGGRSWQIISPDLTREAPGVPSNLDAPTIADNTGLQRRGVVYAIAPSPIEPSIVWAGTDDGYIWITRDDGAHWRNVTPASRTAWSKVGVIDASHARPGTAIAAIDRHRLNDYAPYIFRTTDFGGHWTAIGTGIPNGAFVNVVREDPQQPALLYAGTELGIYVSFDFGSHWQSLQRNLPTSSIRDIAFRGDDVIVATHGRALWILDDAAPLRQIATETIDGRAYLFTPATAYRVRPGNDEGTPLPLDEPTAKNPPAGAIFDYYLRGAAATPVVITVTNADGQIVRHWSSADTPTRVDASKLDVAEAWATVWPLPDTGAGQHRFVWDFHVSNPNGPLAPPGRYRVNLSVDGATFAKPFSVARDPRTAASDVDLRAQYALAQTLETRRANVEALKERAEAFEKRAGLSAAERAIVQREIIGVTPAQDPDDSIGKPSHDFTSFSFLADAYQNLEQAVESADAPPTPDMRAGLLKLDAILSATTLRLNSMSSR
jgi:photosystem II stability/assembly factor-like uncharacterized protein